MLNIIQDLSFFIILGICVIVKIRKTCEKQYVENSVFEKYSNLFFILILLLLFVNISYKISDLPQGLHVDEAGAFYDAICLSNYGTDRYLYRLPVYLINFGGGQSALYAYLAAIMIKIFGISILSFRFPALLLSLLSMLCLYQLVKENANKSQAISSVLLLAICPWNIMKSRWGLDCNLMSSMLIISIYLLVKAFKNNKKYCYFLAGISLGLTLYTYVISYLIIPIILGIMIIYMFIIKQTDFKNLICLGIPLGILAIPLFLMILYNSEIIKNVEIPLFSIPKLWFFRGGEISIKNIPSNLKNIFDILFIKDFLNYNAISEFGTLYKFSIPLVIFGFIETFKDATESVKRKNFSLDFIMLITFLTTFFIGLCIEELNINKLNAIYIPMIYFAGKFLNYLLKNMKYAICNIFNPCHLSFKLRSLYAILLYRFCPYRFGIV